MSALLIDGNKLADQYYNGMKHMCKDRRINVLEDPLGIGQLMPAKLKPTLAILVSDNDPASNIYVRNKMRKCQEVGISCVVAAIAKENKDLAEKTLQQWADDPDVDGIIIQRPSCFEYLQCIIPPHKDVDGAMVDAEYEPCTARGIMALLHSTNQDLAGKHAVVIGRSDTVGKPVARMLLEADCTVTLCHSQTQNLAEHTKSADILVCAVGKPSLVTADMVKPGAIVIDVGINSVPDPANPGKTKMVGDVDFGLVKDVAGWITPVPGGVGPMTVAMLLQNVCDAHKDKMRRMS